MKLGDALIQLAPPVGTTSLLAAMFGDGSAAAGLKALIEPQRTLPTTREDAAIALAGARDELARQEKGQTEATSDAGYWAYQGAISYWKCVADILEAATITGPDSLPDVAIPSGGGVLMDLCAQLERFGKTVVTKAKENAIRNDPEVTVLGVGPGADINATIEPGTARRITMIKGSDVERLSEPLLKVLNDMREGESPDAILGVLMIVTGQIAAQQGAIIQGDQPVQTQLTPLWWGYGQALSVKAQQSGIH